MFKIVLLFYGICCVISLIAFFLHKDFRWDECKEDLHINFFSDNSALSQCISSIIVILLFIVLIIFFPFIFIIILKKDKKDKKEKEDRIPESSDSIIFKSDRPRYQFLMHHDETFRPNVRQIIYMESSYNPEIHDFIRRNYDELRSLFLTEYNKEWCDEGLEFIYLPYFIEALDFSELFSYNRPDITQKIQISKDAILKSIQDAYIRNLYGNVYGSLHPILGQPVEHCAENISIKQGFIHYKRTQYNEYNNKTEDEYTYFPLTYENDKQFWGLIKQYLVVTGTIDCAYSNRKTHQDVPQKYDEEVIEITKEIQERVQRLKCLGLNNMIINKLILPDITLSRLHITKDYRIFLTDYNNTEIIMPTLSKALYFFYLRHPEGIPFKYLDNYKGELFTIYKRITNRDDINTLKKSIEYLVSPEYNSINEKVSRIKSAFISAFDENIAQNYYITMQNTIILNRCITLDRNLVSDESGIVIHEKVS